MYVEQDQSPVSEAESCILFLLMALTSESAEYLAQQVVCHPVEAILKMAVSVSGSRYILIYPCVLDPM